MQQQEETPRIREPHPIPDNIDRDGLVNNMRELLFALGRPANCKWCQGPVYYMRSRNDKPFSANVDGSRHFETCSAKGDRGEAPTSRPCKYCQESIEFKKRPDGGWMVLDAGTQMAHDCKNKSAEPAPDPGAATGDKLPF